MNEEHTEEYSDTSLILQRPASEVLLVVFIHGFKGDHETFAGFPDRMQHILSETISNISVECVVFPAYETKGDLNEAVVRFADWLTTLTVDREVACGGGAGKAKVVLCGHSMGGLLSADTLLEFSKSRPDTSAPLWPKIIACISFDTPYLGLNPLVVKNSASKAVEYADAARTVGTAVFGSLAALGARKATTSTQTTSASRSNPAALLTPPESPISSTTEPLWKRWATPAAFAVGGALLAGATAGGVYYKREDLGLGYAWATDHMKYVGNLWDEEALRRRMDALLEMEMKEGVLFRTFYTLMPPMAPTFASSRTFIVLPRRDEPSYEHFIEARNSLAADEVQAHVGMFAGKTNDGFYDLGLQTAKFIQKAVMLARTDPKLILM